MNVADQDQDEEDEGDEVAEGGYVDKGPTGAGCALDVGFGYPCLDAVGCGDVMLWFGGRGARWETAGELAICGLAVTPWSEGGWYYRHVDGWKEYDKRKAVMATWRRRKCRS